jgi:hypothetical protein
MYRIVKKRLRSMKATPHDPATNTSGKEPRRISNKNRTGHSFLDIHLFLDFAKRKQYWFHRKKSKFHRQKSKGRTFESRKEYKNLEKNKWNKLLSDCYCFTQWHIKHFYEKMTMARSCAPIVSQMFNFSVLAKTFPEMYMALILFIFQGSLFLPI